MHSLDLLGVALGLAVLSGLNLYLTVFATGLAIRMHWVTLAGDFQQLAFLGDEWVLGVAGVLFLLEFFADKIPWVDSVWDALHTVIRPLGGALLATQVLGDASPAFLVVAGLLAGTLSFATHSAKAGTRLIANGSPEPFSNVALSLTEDVAVLGGLALLHLNPVVALVVFLLVLSVILYFAPKLFRAVRVKVWLAYRKLNLPAAGRDSGPLPATLSGRLHEALAKVNPGGETVLWAVPCISKSGPGIAPNLFGTLVATRERPDRVRFVSRGRFSLAAEILELAGGSVDVVRGFLFDEVRLSAADGKKRWAFAFDRSRPAWTGLMADSLRERLAEGAAHPTVANP